MSRRPTAPAQLPPPGIVGLDARWSRLVTVPGIDGVGRTWHLLDSWHGREPSSAPRLTLLCVHGNPSWSFLWRNVITEVPDDIRVIAVDQLDMGFSERSGRTRTLTTRIDDLEQLTNELGMTGPVVTLAHDWGGPISLGWALRHLDRAADRAHLAGVVLTNTAVHQPEGSPAPSVIRLVRSRPMLRPSTVNTLAFVRGAFEMSRPRLSEAVRRGFMAPYLDASRREAIADFVNDIPLDPGHPSASALDDIAEGLNALADTPCLLLWGPRDLVFSDRYLHDLEQRLPHAAVHRFPGAAHFVSEEADVAGAVAAWLSTIDAGSGVQRGRLEEPGGTSRTDRRALADLSVADPAVPAVVEMAPSRRTITFAELAGDVERLAAGMAEFGIAVGDRVALMIPPGIDLSRAIYACWRRGAVVVLVDSGLGPSGMQRALVGADPDYLIGIDRAMAAATVLRWPGRRISLEPLSTLKRRAMSVITDLTALTSSGANRPPLSTWPDPDAHAAVVFTSGATGPSKGVVYRHGQLAAQRDALMANYDINAADRLVAAFAPFALYGPTMGITSVVPDMDVTAPATLTAAALADAAAAVDATLVFASPAALVNTVATADDVDDSARSAFSRVRLLMSAGAPVRSQLLADACALFPGAAAHTPYGMTEVLPVADISLDEIRGAEAGEGDGVCVGRPLASVDVMIDPLDDLGRPSGLHETDSKAGPDVLGEIVVRAAHAREGYDRLWFTQHRASRPVGWHRTGDIGRFDAQGRLWVGGRLGHVITTASGPLAPVRLEQQVEQLDDVAVAAAVGIGPAGTQAVVIVVQPTGEGADRWSGNPAPLELIDRVRRSVATDVDIAAVLIHDSLPVDRRHNSKVDRTAIARWADQTLSGGRVGDR